MKKTDSEKILRNWNRIWTFMTLILSFSVIIIGINYGFSGIEITTEKDWYGDVTDINIHSDAVLGIYSGLFEGFLIFILIQLLQIPIWILRDWLIN